LGASGAAGGGARIEFFRFSNAIVMRGTGRLSPETKSGATFPAFEIVRRVRHDPARHSLAAVALAPMGQQSCPIQANHARKHNAIQGAAPQDGEIFSRP
jgi:hypothetical protein